MLIIGTNYCLDFYFPDKGGDHGERAYEGGRHGHSECGYVSHGGRVQVDGYGPEHGWQQPVNNKA